MGGALYGGKQVLSGVNKNMSAGERGPGKSSGIKRAGRRPRFQCMRIKIINAAPLILMSAVAKT